MKKALPYLGAALSALAFAWSAPVKAQDAFKDVPQDHWAYAAVAELQQKGILLGYPPEGLFKGRRYMTRYEFAVALQRALSKIGGKGVDGARGADGAPGATGATGADGAQGPKGDPGVTPEELAQIRRLANEFKNELAGIGANIGQINSRLDALAKSVADLKSAFDRAPKFGVAANIGTRGDYSRFPFVDRGGAGNFGLKGVSSIDVIHDIHLLVSAKAGKDASFTGDLAFTNYLSYRGNTLSQGAFALNPLLGAAAVSETVMPLQAQLDIPVDGFGENAMLTVGRYKQHGSALTYRRPDLDPYFNIAQYDDGNYIQDGIKLNTKLGSIKTSLFVGSFATVADNKGNAINAPFVGAGAIGAGANNLGGFKPVGINALGAGNAASQVAGINLGLPFFNFAELGVTANIFGTGLASAGNANNPFNTVTVYGANLHFKPIGKLHINAEVAKSVTSSGLDGDGQSNDDNNAYALHVGYGTGPLSIHAGYNDIDPRYGAPGAWMTLGNWYNPTNVRGPYLNLGYKASENLAFHVGGNYLEGARNRPGYLTMSDRVNQVKAGLEYKISSRLTTSLDYEGVMYVLDGASRGLLGTPVPIEQYLTLGAGLQLNHSAKLKVGYQMINWQNVGGGFTGSNSGINGLGAGGGSTSNATVLTTSINVKF